MPPQDGETPPSPVDRAPRPSNAHAAYARRDKSRDGLVARVEFFLLTHGRPFWILIQSVGPVRRWLNAFLINRAIMKAPTRPHALSTKSVYSSWDSLTDRTYSGRRLAPRDLPGGAPPPLERAVDLFRRRDGTVESAKSSLLFSHFAQWFTDGFLRTDRNDSLKNTSNHDIDLSQLYGLSSKHTKMIRAGTGGRLRSQIVNGEEYPPFYFDRFGEVAEPFRGKDGKGDLPILLPPKEIPLSPEREAALFAFGGDRANNQIGYAMLNTLFLREHNRICGVLARDNPDWDDERLFQTARCVLIVVLLKIAVEEYINHITPYHFKFRLDAPVVGASAWHRPNWMTLEFNLLYRWHGLVSDTANVAGRTLPTEATLYNNPLMTAVGLGPLFDSASRQPAGEIGLFNTPAFLIRTEEASLALGRLARLASYNDYRAHVGLPRVDRFEQITGDPERQEALERVYGEVNRVEFYVGLFAEDVRPNSAVSPLIARMVAIDALSQALTNPLLSANVYNARTFTEAGLEVIRTTNTLSDVLHRNIPVPADGRRFLASFAYSDRRSGEA